MFETGIIMMIIFIVIAILIFLVILKLINKFIFKNKVKINWKEISIGWIIVFGINLFCVITDIPYPIGIPFPVYGDGGKTTHFASLGYIIYVEKSTLIGDDIPTKVEFLTLKT